MNSPKRVLSTILVWMLVYYLLARRFHGIFELDEIDQKLMYYSESSFYLSYYYDIVESETWKDALSKMLHDNYTEHPKTIITFRRINIVQGLFIHSFGIAILFAITADFNDSMTSGIHFLGLFISNFQHKLISRISALPLRENFATPSIWCSILAIKGILSLNNERKWCYILFLSHIWSLLSWQFSIHVISTQIACIFALNILGLISNSLFRHILNIKSLALFVSTALMLFPLYNLTSLLTNVICSIHISLWVVNDEGIEADNFHSRVQKGVLTVIVFVFNHFLINRISRPDGHIFDMLFVKLGLSKETFDSLIYSLGVEFRMLAGFMFEMIKSTNIFYYLIPSIVTVLFCIIKVVYLKS
ncbi:signal peptide-containing protein [Theileria equi strain WA]|uniref:Signal peptide-containing protein n=1 Tax=Theileria equi strain WA TaxID=1537102 RepID=L0AWM5_THEEQ|nr:signal peptide-containing protein [Theileria equi strain WA]AFZ79416.1 signal peptide-containing protein [Theileria equi strain WA]|eukprot:XP_004829082.1 signal peptide-containing protein [Theileria equi strain WA]